LIPELPKIPPLFGQFAVELVLEPTSILHMVQAIFDLPMASYHSEKFSWRELFLACGCDVISDLFPNNEIFFEDLFPHTGNLL